MYKLLIIDDEKHTIKALKSIIDFEKYDISTVFQAENGDAGMQIIKDEKPEIIITDMKMPRMDGVELLRRCYDLNVDSQIVIISGYDDFTYLKNAIKYKVLDYILKPIDYAEVNGIIKNAVENIRNGNSHNKDSTDIEHTGIEYKIKDYIERSYTSPISLDILTNKFFISKESITRNFKAKFSMGVYEYVIKLRMEKSKELLINSDYHISEISEMVGFYDSNYFSKAFKKYFNISASRMRQDNIDLEN